MGSKAPLGKRLVIQVTNHDIWNGVHGDMEHCPIALALRRHPLIQIAVVDGRGAQIWTRRNGDPLGPDPDIVYVHDAKQFVEEFDMYLPVAPRTVRLEKLP